MIFHNKVIRESTTNLLDMAGESVVSYEYSDYGETTINGNIDFYNKICYTGRIYDKNIELYYLNARYYDPENANFLSQDTYRGEIGEPESLNYYGYCQGNPVTYTDPSGHIPLLATAMWGYRVYKGYKAVKNTAKLVKTTYKVAKKVKKLSSFKKSYKVVKAGKKAKRIASKPKVSKKLKKLSNKSYKKSRVKTVQKSNKKKVSQSKSSAQKTSSVKRKTGCFVAETKISSEKGFKNIKDIKVGDRVWSEDTKTGKKALKRVKKIFVFKVDSMF